MSGTPLVSVWQAEEYHAAPINWRILQHPRNGFIYVANNFGVLEFDGATWRLIPLPRGGAARSLVVDAKGTLWVGGVGELCTLEPDATGSLRPVDRASQLPVVASSGADAAAEVGGGDDDAGSTDPHRVGVVIRAVTGADGVYFGLPGRVVRFAPDGAVTVFPLDQTMGSLHWSDGALHVSSRGLLRLRDGKFERVAEGNGVAVLAMADAADGPASPARRVLGSRGPLAWAGPGRALPEPAEAVPLFQTEQPTCAAFLPDGRAIYGTVRHGLLIFDANGHFERQIGAANGLPPERINAVCLDREGGLWVAMHFALARVQLGSPFATHGAAQGLAGGPRDLLRFRDRLYVAHGEGFAWRDDATGRFREVEGFRIGSHHAVAVGNRLIVSGSGLYEVPADRPAVRLHPNLHYGLFAPSRPAGALLASGAPAVYFIPSLDAADERQTVTSLPAGGANQFLETGDGAIWTVLRTDEIWRLDARGGMRPDAPARRYLPANGIPPARRRDGLRLLQIGGELLASSTQWLLRYDAAADKFVPETRLGAIAPGRGPVAACDEEKGTGAWFYFAGDDAHLTHAQPDGRGGWSARNYPAPELGDLLINALYYDAPRRTLWIAGQGALVSFTPESVGPEPLPLRALVHHVEDVNGRRLWAAPATAAALGPLRLTAAQNALRFAFSAPTYRPDYRGRIGTQFRTRLDGLDRDWTPWTSEPRRDFTNLPFRDLVFRVQARDLSGRTSPETPLAFSIAPPWWLTPWAYLGYALLAAVGVFGIVLLRTRALRRRAAQLENVVVQRTSELAARNRELARLHQLELDEKTAAQLGEEKARLEVLRYQLNPHFLYNALGSIRSLVHSRPDEADDMTMQLADFCRMTLTRRDDQASTLDDELKMITAYLDMERTRWRERLQTRVDVDPAAQHLRLPPFLLLPLVENAIKYGTRTGNENVHVTVTARQEAGRLIIQVANSGRWVEPARPPALSPTSTGIGLENLRQRLQRYYGGEHRLTIDPSDGWVRVRLDLPIPAASLSTPEKAAASLAAPT